MIMKIVKTFYWFLDFLNHLWILKEQAPLYYFNIWFMISYLFVFVCLFVCLFVLAVSVSLDQITGHGVPLPDGDQPMTTFQITQCLQNYNYLGPNNVWYLQYILFVLGKKDLYRRVWNYAISRLKTHQPLYLHDVQSMKGN